MAWQYFKRSEFACNCGCGEDNISERFLSRLDFAREAAGIPFSINSGARCAIHNKKVGGSPTSSHLASATKISHAADISARDGQARFKIVKALQDAGFTRIGIADTFIHVDDDPAKVENVIWTY